MNKLQMKNALATIEAALPDTYYAALPLPERVVIMAQHWRRLVAAVQKLEEECDRLRSAHSEEGAK